MSNVDRVTKFRRERKKNLIELFFGECSLCGYNKSESALEFHHINPEEKKYGIAASGLCHSIEDDIKECKKCLLVCANCHREIHAGLYDSKDLFNYQKIDSNKEKELLSPKIVKKYYCKNCGTEILKNKNELCRNCYNISKRKIDRPDRETLKQLIRTLPFTVIGKQYHGMSDNGIRKWCISMGLPSTKKEINSFSDEEWALI